MKPNQWRPVATDPEVRALCAAAPRGYRELRDSASRGQRWAGTSFARVAAEGRRRVPLLPQQSASTQETMIAEIIAASRAFPVVEPSGFVLTDLYCMGSGTDPIECRVFDGRAVNDAVLRAAERIFGKLVYRVQPLANHSDNPPPIVGYLGAHACLIAMPLRGVYEGRARRGAKESA